MSEEIYCKDGLHSGDGNKGYSHQPCQSITQTENNALTTGTR